MRAAHAPFALLLFAVPANLTAQSTPPAAARAFAPFAPAVKTRWDAKWLYVESNGMPQHVLMTGIRAWQQQVPLPQDYTGANAWQVPLQPKAAAAPQSAKTGFFRGAIAIAVDGVPIFNPIKNDGHTDTFLAGELDLFGGHAGRADDYHYHVAPVFLNGGDDARPIAYALDGYPVYGFREPDGAPARPLDTLNGHDDAKYGYHYHATEQYPYLNGGFHGEVTERGGQVDPQPHEHPVRAATAPLPGARITGFVAGKDGRSYTLTYELGGKQGTVAYTVQADGSVHFVFTDPDGKQREETGRPNQRGSGGGERNGEGGGQRGGQRGGEREGRGNGERGEPPVQDPQDPAAPRQPWLAAHLAEIDDDGDQVLTRAELDHECEHALQSFDSDRDGVVSVAERDARGAGRSAMGGFVKQHWREVDADGDDVVTQAEITACARSMFDKADRDGDGRATAADLSAQDPQRGRGNGGNGNGGGGGRGRGYAAIANGFQTDAPARPFDLLLASPTATSVQVSVAAWLDTEGYVEFGADPRKLDRHTATQRLPRGEATSFALTDLPRDHAVSYRLRWRPAGPGAGEFAASDVHTFHTPRPAGSRFVFTVQADSHLDASMTPAIYEQALRNAAADRPDFHVDLGDTFMTEKRQAFRDALPQYEAQRFWLGQLCRSAPLFQALGNHDGEWGFEAGGADSLGAWSAAQRTRLFPPPRLGDGDATYSGRTQGGNWFAFEWGDVLCVVLDPFSATTDKPRGRGAGGANGETIEFTDASWSMTLGREQYDWLARTLAQSRAAFKFVFLHHLVGGRGTVARGGVEAAPYFEWGGKNADGGDGFAAHRPGWPLPIHRLLVQHGVRAVFHGHDHLFVRGELDGITYQCVPQPGNARGNMRTAAEYGYASGTILGSPGLLRVTVAPAAATVEFVRASLGSDNGSVVHAYELRAR